MANNSDKGSRQFMLDYKSNIVYPYTLLDCIMDGSVNEDLDEGKAVASGITAILDKLVTDKCEKLDEYEKNNKNAKVTVLGISKDVSTNKLIYLDDLGTYSNDNITFLGNNGYFNTLATDASYNGAITHNPNKGCVIIDTSLYITSTTNQSGHSQILHTYTGVTLNLHNDYFDALNGPIKVKYANKTANLKDVSIGSLTDPIYYDGTDNSFKTCSDLRCKADNINFDNKNIIPGDKNNLSDTSIIHDSHNIYMPLYLDSSAYKLVLKQRQKDNELSGLLSLATNDNLKVDKLYFDVNEADGMYVIAYDTSKGEGKVEWKKYVASLNLDYNYFSSSSNKDTDKLKTETPCYLIGNPFNKVNENTQLPQSIDSAACATNGSVGIYFKGTKLYQTSDERLKTFTSPIDINFDNLLEIKKGEFYWNDDPDKTPDLGVSAQSLEAIYPQIVDEVEGTKTVSYNRLGVIALAAIDKLHLRIKELEKEVKALKKELNK